MCIMCCCKGIEIPTVQATIAWTELNNYIYIYMLCAYILFTLFYFTYSYYLSLYYIISNSPIYMDVYPRNDKGTLLNWS